MKRFFVIAAAIAGLVVAAPSSSLAKTHHHLIAATGSCSPIIASSLTRVDSNTISVHYDVKCNVKYNFAVTLEYWTGLEWTVADCGGSGSRVDCQHWYPSPTTYYSANTEHAGTQTFQLHTSGANEVPDCRYSWVAGVGADDTNFNSIGFNGTNTLGPTC